MKNRHFRQDHKSFSAQPQPTTTTPHQPKYNNGEFAGAQPHSMIEKPNQTSINDRPPHDEVAKIAYQIYLQEGCPQGRDLQHWLEAEAQLAAVAVKSKTEVTANTETTIRTEIGATAKTGKPGPTLALPLQPQVH
jgi:hypothetical protein